MKDHDRTDKIDFIPRCTKREASAIVAGNLERALTAASHVGHDIHDAIAKLLSSVRRREIEYRGDKAA